MNPAATTPPAARPTAIQAPVPFPSPVRTVPWPTPTFTPLTGPIGNIPNAAVQILRPGDESYVVSPFSVFVQIHRSVFPTTVFLELWAQIGDEARLLYRRLYRYNSVPESTWVWLQEEIPFEIRQAEVWGRLQVRLTDAAGIPVAQQAVHLHLLRFGLPQDSHRDQILLPIVVRSPKDDAWLPLQGTLHIEGLARYTTGLMELLFYTPQGRVLKSLTLSLSQPDPQGYARFALEWPYRFSSRQDLRLVFRLYDPRVRGVAYMESVLLHFR